MRRWRGGWIAGLLAGSLALMMAAPAAKAQADKKQHEARMQALNGPPPYLFAKAEEPAWVERVLNKLAKQNRLKATDHRLFHKDGKPTYLAVEWWGKRSLLYSPSWLSVYKVNVISPENVRLRFVRGDEETSFSFQIASGYDLTGEGVPILSVLRWAGGRYEARNGVQVYKLVGNTVDITPEHSHYFSAKLLGDGSGAAAVDLDTGWQGFFPGCGPCGPMVDIVYRSTPKGRFPDCVAHPGHYESEIDWLIEEPWQLGRYREAERNGAWGLRPIPAFPASRNGNCPQPSAGGEDRGGGGSDEQSVAGRT